MELRCFTLESTIEYIDKIPYLALKSMKISHLDSADKDLFNELIWHHKGLKIWFKRLILLEKIDDLVLKEYSLVKPWAELWECRLPLITALHERSEKIQLLSLAPLDIWLWCIHCDAYAEIERYLCQGLARKRQEYQTWVKALDGSKDRVLTQKPIRISVDDKSSHTCVDRESKQALNPHTEIWLLIGAEAEILSVKDDIFYSNHYEPQLLAEARVYREIDRSKEIQFASNVNGKILVTGKGKKISKAKNKGFKGFK
jgi:predicted Fe-S protein YdhL (DUF1289 family)